MAYSKEVKRVAEKYLTLYKQLTNAYGNNVDAFKDILNFIENDYSTDYTFKCRLQDYIMFTIKSKGVWF